MYSFVLNFPVFSTNINSIMQSYTHTLKRDQVLHRKKRYEESTKAKIHADNET